MLSSESFPIKIDCFKTQYAQYQSKLRDKQDEYIKLQEEFNKLHLISQKFTESKIKILNELTEQKSRIKLLEGQIDIKKKYLNSLIQDHNDITYQQEIQHKQNLQSLFIHIKDATIKANEFIKRNISPSDNTNSNTITLKELNVLDIKNIELLLKNIR